MRLLIFEQILLAQLVMCNCAGVRVMPTALAAVILVFMTPKLLVVELYDMA